MIDITSITTWLFLYLLIINLWTFAAFGADKRKAVKGKWRIPEKRLLLYAALGGSVGAAAGMLLFHHKTKKYKFSIGIPLIFAAQCLLFVGIFESCI